MKKINIPRPRKMLTFSEKFGREVSFFGSHEKREPPRYGHVPLILLCLLGAALLCLTVLLTGRLWKVRSVVASDGELYTATAILEYADVEAGDEMLGFDASAVAARLKEKLPLLNTVKVRKGLNGTVTITVTEETDLYYTRHNVNYYIISATTRRVLCVSASSDEARRVGATYIGFPEEARIRVGDKLSFVYLPYAVVTEVEEVATYEVQTEEPDEEFSYVFEFVETLMASELASRVVGMELSDRYDLWLVLDGSIKVRIGNMDELDRKLTMVERSLADREQSGTTSDGLPTLVDVSDPARIIHRTSPDIEMPDWAEGLA